MYVKGFSQHNEKIPNSSNFNFTNKQIKFQIMDE